MRQEEKTVFERQRHDFCAGAGPYSSIVFKMLGVPEKVGDVGEGRAKIITSYFVGFFLPQVQLSSRSSTIHTIPAIFVMIRADRWLYHLPRQQFPTAVQGGEINARKR